MLQPAAPEILRSRVRLHRVQPMQVGRGKPNPMSHPLDGKVWVGEIFLDAAADALQVVVPAQFEPVDTSEARRCSCSSIIAVVIAGAAIWPS